MTTYTHPQHPHIKCRGSESDALVLLDPQPARELHQHLVDGLGLVDILEIIPDPELGGPFLMINAPIPHPFHIAHFTYRANKALHRWGLELEDPVLNDAWIRWSLSPNKEASCQLLHFTLVAEERDLRERARQDAHAMELWANHPDVETSSLFEKHLEQCEQITTSAREVMNVEVIKERLNDDMIAIFGLPEGPDILVEGDKTYRLIDIPLQLRRHKNLLLRAITQVETLGAAFELERRDERAT